MDRFAHETGDNGIDWDAGFPSLPSMEAAPAEEVAF